MKCQSCGSDRLMHIIGKTSDMCDVASLRANRCYDGYVPEAFSGDYGGGDYIDLTICVECGQVQGEWPKSDEDCGFKPDEDCI